MSLQSAALDKIKESYGYGKTNYGKEENPSAYAYGPHEFLFSDAYVKDKYYPLPRMMTHDGYEIHQSWKREAGQ